MTDTERPEDEPDTVRLLSYNVRYAGLDTGANAWEQRRDGVASVVGFHRPDLVALQEVWMTQLDDLRERLPSFDWIGERILDGEHTPVGHRPDRFAVTDREVFALSEDPEAYEVPGWDASLPRVTTRVSFREVESGARFAVFNTHFDHEGTQARLESARLLRERVADLDVPAIVAGDLNCGRDDPPYRILAGGREARGDENGNSEDRDADGEDRDDDNQTGLTDARTVAADPQHGPETTFNDFDAPRPGERMDHVFVTDGIAVRRYGVPTDVDRRGRYPSDHFPVVVDFEVRPRRE